jgi:tetratricopeptide (TPR) repeat protein
VDAVDARIAQLHARNPYALRLAILSAFAVRLEPHLLRALRRAFEPHSDPSAELDLWHSTVVGSRGASAALLEVEALARLRAALSQDLQRDLAYRRTLECLEGYPPLHRFEVELNALPVLDPAVGDAAIDSHFAPVLADLRHGGEGAQRAARWLLQAAPRWHPRVRDTAAAWAALLASSALLGGRRLIPNDPPRNLSSEALAQALPASLSATRQVGIVLTREHLRFLLADMPDVAHVNAPAMSPALMVVEREDGSQSQVINAEPGSETPTGGADVVILRSLTGETWRVEREQEPSVEVSHPKHVEVEAATATQQGPDADHRETRQDNDQAAETARLEEAVAAYRAALAEMTRERVPLDWATTQNNLGNALNALGERESGTARLEEAVAAYRAALEERTRERVPRQWASTQQGLANALAELAKRRTDAAPAEPQRGEPPSEPLLEGQDQE